MSKEEYLTDQWLEEPYGNPRRDVANSIRKVRDKFRQAIAPHAIIAVWNDDEALEELDVHIALCKLQQDPHVPAGFELVVYGSPWIGHFQLYFSDETTTRCLDPEVGSPD